MVGGGTGYSLLYLAEQLSQTDAEVKLYLVFFLVSKEIFSDRVSGL